MTGVDGVNKFTIFLAAAQGQNAADPYDIDLKSTITDVGRPVNQFTFTGDGTVLSNCDCLSQVVSCVCA
jgi:hypothetical protein